MIPTNKKNYFPKTLMYFTNLYSMWKAYNEYRATKSGPKNDSNINHTAPPSSATNNSLKTTRKSTGNVTTTQEKDTTSAYAN